MVLSHKIGGPLVGHLSIKPVSWETPVPSEPRKRGQSSPVSSLAKEGWAASKVARRSRSGQRKTNWRTQRCRSADAHVRASLTFSIARTQVSALFFMLVAPAELARIWILNCRSRREEALICPGRIMSLLASLRALLSLSPPALLKRRRLSFWSGFGKGNG